MWGSKVLHSWIGDRQISGYCLKSSLVGKGRQVQTFGHYLFPARRRHLVMFTDEIHGKCIALRCSFAIYNKTLAIIIAQILEDNNQVIETVERLRFDWKASITICLVSAFYLNANLFGNLAWIGVNTNQIVSFVARRCFIRQNISTHKATHYRIFSTQRNNRELQWHKNRYLKIHSAFRTPHSPTRLAGGRCRAARPPQTSSKTRQSSRWPQHSLAASRQF